MTITDTATEWALYISEFMEYGDHDAGEVQSWTPEKQRDFCQDYIYFVIGLNGIGELFDSERRMIRELKLKTT